MKAIIHLTITDEERTKMSQSLGYSGMVTRKQVTETIEAYIKKLVAGDTDENPEPTSAPREVGTPDFTPSRGDEPYLYRANDPKLAALCSTALDGLDALDRYVWNKLEENRQ